MKMSPRELATKIQNLINTTPDWDNISLTNDVRKWLSDAYSYVEMSGASNELPDLRREIDLLTGCLENPGPATEATKKFANKIANILFRALSKSQADAHVLSQYRPITFSF